MKQEIKYGGYSVNRSDYDSVDGELAFSMGMLNEEGQQRHIPQPKQLAEMPEGYEVMYIHKTANYTHYIVKLRTLQPHPGSLPDLVDKLYWLDESVITTADTLPVPAATVSENLHYIDPWYDPLITEITSVGNTLVVLAGDGVHYILWKGDSYQYLGNHIPETALSFGLQAHATRATEHEEVIPLNSIFPSWTAQQIEIYIQNYGRLPFDDDTLPQDEVKKLSDKIIGLTNKFITEKATKKGKFLFPFLVRYAYRLYDGSLTMHSSPVLMVTNSELTPRAYITEFDDSSLSAKTWISAMLCDLDYALIEDTTGELAAWKDIIQSVDVFVSAPLYVYKQDGEVTGITRTPQTAYTIAQIPTSHDTFFEDMPEDAYGDHAHWSSAQMLTGSYDRSGNYEFELPKFDQEDIDKAVRECGSFYLLKSLDLDEITTERKVINISDEYLVGLVGREVMTDDYDSHEHLIPSQSFVYNSRLSIADITKKLLFPYPLQAYVPFTDHEWDLTQIRPIQMATRSYTMQIFTEHNGKTFLSDEIESELGRIFPMRYFYFQNGYAKKIIIKYTRTNTYTQENEEVSTIFDLERHAFLNGSVFFDGYDIDADTYIGTPPSTYDADGNLISLPNKIYTSEVDNPFFFPVTSISTVGTGKIIGISTAAKPLSEGQFGQFPLYAFTTEGVWSMQVGNTGRYTPGQPIIPDVALSRESIAQIDDTVFFATKRGIMMIAGRDAQCVSDMLISDETFDISSLPHLADLLPSTLPTDIKPFQEFVHGCRMSYDYLNQRIVVFNPTDGDTEPLYPYAYVLSTKSKLWGMMPCNLMKTLNSYPDALLQDLDGYLVSLSETAEGSDSQHPVATSLILTRPLKLGDGNVLKTIHVLVQRGKFRKGSVKTVLYGSRDLWSWHLVGSSTCHWLRGLRGSGYKYFRIALLTTMAKDESVSGATVLFDPRYLGRIH